MVQFHSPFLQADAVSNYFTMEMLAECLINCIVYVYHLTFHFNVWILFLKLFENKV